MAFSMRLNCFRAALAVAIVAAGTAALSAQQLNTLHPATGSTILYGQVANQSTEAGAMAAILRNVHRNVGEKPEVGRLFQVRGTESVAVFFGAMRHTGAPVRVAGLIIATKVSTDHVEAAMITDEAARFHKLLPANMKALFAVWHPLQAQAGGGSAASVPLQQQTLPDRSASVKLPADWKILPRMSGGGTICASGPNAETAFLGLGWLAEDTRNPQVQRLQRQVQAGALRNTVYASAAYVPYGADPARTYVYLFNHSRGNMGAADFNIRSATPMPGGGTASCTHLSGTVDFRDQHGVREMDAIFCAHPPRPAGVWMSEAFVTTAPVALAGRERATLAAIMQSFTVNQAVVSQEAAQIAAPAIRQIRAIGAAAAAQAQAAHRAEDIHNSSVYQHWDSMDKRSQEFENYQLGMTVISDNQNTAHGTFWSQDADALVKANPDRFEYVSAPNYWKGIDY